MEEEVPTELTPQEKIKARSDAGLMNIEAEVELRKMLQLDPESLTTSQRQFICARRTYLNNEQKRVFGEVIEQTLAELKKANGEDEVETPKAKKAESKKDEDEKSESILDEIAKD